MGQGKNIKDLAASMIVSIILVVVAIALISNGLDEVAGPATYNDGDRNPGFIVGTSPAEVGTNSEGIIDCDGNNGNDSSLCGKGKFTALLTVLPVIEVLLIIIAAIGVLGTAGSLVSRNLGGRDFTVAPVLITGTVSATAFGAVVLIVIPITFQPLQNAIMTANLDGYSGAIPLLKLVPFILVVGALVVGSLLTGLVGYRTKTIN